MSKDAAEGDIKTMAGLSLSADSRASLIASCRDSVTINLLS